MTKREILQVLDNNVRNLRQDLRNTRNAHDRNVLKIRLEEAERIRDAIRDQNKTDRLNNLL